MREAPRGRPLPRGAARLVIGGLLAAASLSACGQPTPGGDDDVEPTVSVAVQPTLRPETSTPEPVDPSAPSAGGLFDATQSLVSSECKPTGEVWNFTGRLENTDTDAHRFTVAVSIVKTADGASVATKEVVVEVPAAGAAAVEAKAFHTGPATGVECLTGVTVKEGD